MHLFNSSYQSISFRQQIISCNQSYPCPRCNCGILETYGLTETLQCSSCQRNFVALRGGRYLHPANSMGVKIAPTFWWDGLRWHWAGTTASTRQITVMFMLLATPLMALALGYQNNLFKGAPDWLNLPLAMAAASLLGMQALYFFCWDFDFVARRRPRARQQQVSEP